MEYYSIIARLPRVERDSEDVMLLRIAFFAFYSHFFFLYSSFNSLKICWSVREILPSTCTFLTRNAGRNQINAAMPMMTSRKTIIVTVLLLNGKDSGNERS